MVPWLGIESVTSWYIEQRSTNWGTLARAKYHTFNENKYIFLKQTKSLNAENGIVLHLYKFLAFL